MIFRIQKRMIETTDHKRTGSVAKLARESCGVTIGQMSREAWDGRIEMNCCWTEKYINDLEHGRRNWSDKTVQIYNRILGALSK